MSERFTIEDIPVTDAAMHVRRGGSGLPVVLLHGHPRTGSTWHRVAPLLAAEGRTVVVPDLRGYGASGGPGPTADHRTASKRAMASDIVEVMTHLGHERFDLVGHDRGSYAALRLALDHPDRVNRVALLDCLPITEHLERITPESPRGGSTGSSSLSRMYRSESSMRIRMPGTTRMRRSWASRTMRSGYGRYTIPMWCVRSAPPGAVVAARRSRTALW